MTPVERTEVEQLARRSRITAMGHRILAKELHRAGYLESAIQSDIEAQKYDEDASRLELKLKRANK